uniref:Dof1 n=1 Tax=Arundo donax TaxID=35708 RepID=A0A0A9B3J2_ARUDO
MLLGYMIVTTTTTTTLIFSFGGQLVAVFYSDG